MEQLAQESSGWACAGSPREYAVGSTIFWQGGTSDAVFILERGLVALQRLSPAGDIVGVCLIRPGEVFGEEALFGRPNPCFAEALAPSLVSRVPVAQMRMILNGHTQTGLELMGQLQSRTAELMRRMESLVSQEVRSRVADILLALADQLGRPVAGRVVMKLPVSQTKLAALVCSTRQSVNALLGMFEAEGLIARSGRELRILDVEALRAVAAQRRRSVPVESQEPSVASRSAAL